MLRTREEVSAAGRGGGLVGVTAIALAFGASLFLVGFEPWQPLVLATIVGLAISVYEWELLVGFMIGVGFFAGTLRMLYGTWSAYAIPDILVGLVLVRWFGRQAGTSEGLLGKTAVSLPYTFLVIYCVIELLNPEAPFFRSLFGLRSTLMYTTLLFAGYAGYRDPRQFERLSRVVIVLGAVTGAYGIWQWYQGSDALAGLGGSYAAQIADMQWGPVEGGRIFRAPSTFVLSGAFAANMAPIIILALGSALSRGSSPAWKVSCALGMAIMAGGIAVSGSRMGPGYLAIGLAMILACFRKFRALFIVLLVAPLSLWLIREVGGGVLAERFATLLDPNIFFWKWAAPLWAGVGVAFEHPLGEGLGFAVGLPSLLSTESQFIKELSSGAVIDSGYGILAAELGLPGLLLYAWFAVRLAVAGIRAWRTLPEGGSREAFLGPAAWAAALPLVTTILGPYASAPLGMYQWTLIGMLLRAGTVGVLPAGAGQPDRVTRGVRRSPPGGPPRVAT